MTPQKAERTTGELDHVLVSGIAWTALAKWATQILSWASTLIVARVLSPDDFGIVAMALVYLGFVQMINDLGLGAAILQNRSLTESQLSRLYGLAMLFGAALTAVSVSLAWPIAAFFENDKVAPVVIVLSVTLFFTGVQVLPRSLLARDLQFQLLARIDGVQAVTMAAATLGFALLGFEYWSLVLGNVVGAGVVTLVLMAYRPHPVAWPRQLGELLGALRFGGHVILSSIGWFIYGNADSVVAGRLLGTAALGSYAVIASLASAPVIQVTGMMSRVTAGVFAAVQADHAKLRRYVTAILEASAFVIFPACAGLSLVAADFIPLVIGEQWHAGIVPLTVLGVAAALRCLAPVLAQALLYAGHPERNSQTTLAGAVVLPVMFVIGASWGLTGIAMAWVVGTLFVLLPTTMYFARLQLSLRVHEVVAAIWPPMLCTMIMTAMVGTVDVLVVGTEISAGGLALQVATGVIAYVIAVRALYWPKVVELRALVDRARGKA